MCVCVCVETVWGSIIYRNVYIEEAGWSRDKGCRHMCLSGSWFMKFVFRVEKNWACVGLDFRSEAAMMHRARVAILDLIISTEKWVGFNSLQLGLVRKGSQNVKAFFFFTFLHVLVILLYVYVYNIYIYICPIPIFKWDTLTNKLHSFLCLQLGQADKYSNK